IALLHVVAPSGRHLVGRREDLDDGDELHLRQVKDFNPPFSDFDFLSGERDRRRLQRCSPGEASFPAMRWAGFSPPGQDIGKALWVRIIEGDQLDATLDLGEIRFRQPAIEARFATHDQHGVKALPETTGLQVRVDARKWARHDGFPQDKRLEPSYWFSIGT